MKMKLLQVLLGAIGSALSILLTHLANVPADVALGVAAASGPVASVTLSDAVSVVFDSFSS